MYNRDFNLYPYITEGYVMSTDDPEQMGRLKVWCPALDGDSKTISNLPWAEYATPFGGITVDFPVGRNDTPNFGPASYGFWSIPKLNAKVLIFLLNGNPNTRCYFASVFGTHMNRSLPAGRNTTTDNKGGPWTDTYEPIQPAYANLHAAFGQNLNSPIAKTRGVYERQVAQDRTVKDGSEGYAKAAADPSGYLDPQTYCWTTPGHHFITMNDSADNCRIRIRSCEGNQVILDDTNERIYISTAKGNTWVELDEDGHIHIYGSQSISMRSEMDINIAAERNINLEAKSGINMKCPADIRLDSGNIHLKAGAQLVGSGCSVDFNSSATKISGGTIDLKSEGLFAMEGSKVTVKTGTKPTDDDKDERILPGGPAAQAACAIGANGPSIIPSHEPFGRPANKTRNKNYQG
jgi:hypothetical protein